MKAIINEYISKKSGWLTFSLMKGEDIVVSTKFEGLDSFQYLMEYLDTSDLDLKAIDWVNCDCKGKGLDYLVKFENIKTVAIQGFSESILPDLSKLKKLETIHFNQTRGQLTLTNLSSSQSIKKLYFGDFTFGKAVEIRDFNEILKCKSLEELFLSNANFPETELDKLKHLKTLKKLTINQKYSFERLAELSIILSDIECNEFRAWSPCDSSFGDVKINGKRKPYLNSKIDRDKIKKYELEFEELKKNYAK